MTSTLVNPAFAPGCALILYKPHLADALHAALRKLPALTGAPVVRVDTCCRHTAQFGEPTVVVNTCPGCDRRYRTKGGNSATVSAWELLAEAEEGVFPFPDYGGARMSIGDACPTRKQPQVHRAVRELLRRMNISLVEPERTAAQSTCCGDSLYGSAPIADVKELMAKRASEMPESDVVVYCVSCLKSMFIGGRQPRYLVDLLFGEETVPGTLEPDDWHAELKAFIHSH